MYIGTNLCTYRYVSRWIFILSGGNIPGALQNGHTREWVKRILFYNIWISSYYSICRQTLCRNYEHIYVCFKHIHTHIQMYSCNCLCVRFLCLCYACETPKCMLHFLKYSNHLCVWMCVDNWLCLTVHSKHAYLHSTDFLLTNKKLALKRFDISRTVMSSLTLWQLMLRLSRYTHTITRRYIHTHTYTWIRLLCCWSMPGHSSLFIFKQHPLHTHTCIFTSIDGCTYVCT